MQRSNQITRLELTRSLSQPKLCGGVAIDSRAAANIRLTGEVGNAGVGKQKGANAVSKNGHVGAGVISVWQPISMFPYACQFRSGTLQYLALRGECWIPVALPPPVLHLRSVLDGLSDPLGGRKRRHLAAWALGCEAALKEMSGLNSAWWTKADIDQVAGIAT
jgi:hypothetical protein